MSESPTRGIFPGMAGLKRSAIAAIRSMANLCNRQFIGTTRYPYSHR